MGPDKMPLEFPCITHFSKALAKSTKIRKCFFPQLIKIIKIFNFIFLKQAHKMSLIILSFYT